MPKKESPETVKPELSARILELAARLDAIMGGPGSAAEFVLSRAVRAEEAVYALLGKPRFGYMVDAAAALEHDLRNLWAPSVIIALWDDGQQRECPRIVSRPDGTAKVTPNMAARSRIARVQKALTRLPKRVTDAERKFTALSLAREIAVEKRRIVAKRHGTTPDALKKQIARERKAHPSERWPVRARG